MGGDSDGICISASRHHQYHGFIIFTPGPSTIVIGACRLFALICFFVYNYRNKLLLQRKGTDSVNIVRGLVLPSYYPVIYSIMFIDIVFGLSDIIINAHNDISDAVYKNTYIWLFPLQFGLLHTIYEGVAIFMMKYGAGMGAFQESLYAAIAWGILSALFIYYAMCYFFSFNHLEDSEHFNAVYLIFLAYNVILCLFYIILSTAPIERIYMRPALKEYAKINVAIYLYWVIFSSIIHFVPDSEFGWTCASSIVAIILVGFIQPYAIWRLLQGDSQYWQGLTPDSNNPLKEVWDQVDIETATTMGDGISRLTEKLTQNEVGAKSTLGSHFRKKEKTVPLLHFGLITMNKDIGYVAGGFSRVYFGMLKKEKVALKIMFAMELTPSAVLEFYEEAKMLHLLKHDQVVICKGVCVMPPAVAIVLEFCLYGSLFDFIYKARDADDSSYIEVDPSYIGTDQSPAKNREYSNDMLGGMTNINLSSSQITRPTEFIKNPLATINNSSTGLEDDTIFQNIGNMDSKTPRTSKDSLWSTYIDTPPQKYNNSVNSGNSGHNVRKSVSYFNTSKGGRGAVDDELTSAGQMSYDGRKRSPSAMDRLGLGLGLGFRSTAALDPPKKPLAHNVPISIRYNMVLDVCKAIEFIHSKGYMHCDIKSLNFLVSSSYAVKLTDFGEARHVDQQPKRDVPPIPAINWAPPEVLSPFANRYSYTIKSDIFSLAVVISEILMLELPYGTECDKCSTEVWYHKLSSEKVRPNLPNGIPHQLQDAVQKAWETKPLERPTSEEFHQMLSQKEICNFFGIGSDETKNRLNSFSNEFDVPYSQSIHTASQVGGITKSIILSPKSP